MSLKRSLKKYLNRADAKRLLEHKKNYLSLTRSSEETTSTSSKIGGYGYLPTTIPYPLNPDKQPLSLLAQINFSEMPSLQFFPTEGILAFYIDSFDDLEGSDFDDRTNQIGFRVYYFKDTLLPCYSKQEITRLFSVFQNLDMYHVVQYEEKLIPNLAETVPLGDHVEFTQVFGESFYDYYKKNLHGDTEAETFAFNYSFGTKIGGFPAFTQADPREYDTELEDYFNVLLFQLDSDPKNVDWGGGGIGNFFINQQDLINRDFSTILYNWDC